MQARRLPARQGVAWLLSGVALFRRAPAYLGMIVFGYFVILLGLSLIPLLGQLAASLLMPSLSAGVMTVCRGVAQGQAPVPGLLWQPLQQRGRALAAIGALYLLLNLSVLLLTSLVDGGLLLEIFSGQRPLDEATANDPALQQALIVGTALSLPVMMAYWLAPLLCAWHGISGAKALFFSFVLVWVNWRAMLVFSLALLAAVLGVAMVLGLVAAIIPPLGGLLAVLMPVVALPVIFASLYANAADLLSGADVSPRIDTQA